jgi:hypothetical protein
MASGQHPAAAPPSTESLPDDDTGVITTVRFRDRSRLAPRKRFVLAAALVASIGVAGWQLWTLLK